MNMNMNAEMELNVNMNMNMDVNVDIDMNMDADMNGKWAQTLDRILKNSRTFNMFRLTTSNIVFFINSTCGNVVFQNIFVLLLFSHYLLFR
jgi:hypothetical protein